MAFDDGGYPITRRAGVYPLSSVKAGDKGVGYTVFHGSKVEAFDVEVLGILEGMLGPGRDVILARLSGKPIEFYGVISGMSGSPVYIDGRIAGAVSYRFGAFAKEPIAGITPIESMLAVYGEEVAPEPKNSPRKLAFTIPARSREPGPPLPIPQVALRGPSGPNDPRPIETPIVLGGFPPESAAALKARFEEAGMFAVVGSGSFAGARSSTGEGGSPRVSGRLDANKPAVAGGVQSAPIAPGAPIAAVLMRGDVYIAATGTVTFVEGGTVLGFGHPFFGFGYVSFPMATAAVLNTLASMSGSYKQASPALEVGVITHDRLTAIGGTMDRIAPMVPLQVTLQSADGTKKAASPLHRLQVEIVDHDVWMPVLVEAAIGIATNGWLGAEAGGTIDARTTIEVGDRAVEVSDTFAAFSPVRVGGLVAHDVALIAATLAQTAIERAEIKKIEVKLTARREPEVAWIETVVPDRTTVEPGETLKLLARLRPYRGKPAFVTLEVPIPRDAEGEVKIYTGGAVELDRRDNEVYGGRAPEDLDDLLGLIAERRPGRGIYARSYVKRPGLRSNVELLSSLPISTRIAIEQQAGAKVAAVSEAFGPAVALSHPDVVVGGVEVVVRVAPN